MTNTGNNPFAEPDFSSLQTPGGSEATDEDYDDDAEDLEGEFDEDELEDPDELDQSEDDEPGGAELSANDPEVASGEEAEEDDAAGNRVAGGTARSVLEHVARSIVDDPEGVAVEVSETRNGIHLALHVAQGDMGRIIGRRGRTAQALRTLVRAAAARDSQEASVDIVD
jgi:predicted RNA-binding protein YlqC (UPF0109 family)